MTSTYLITVGVDGSAEGRRALDWAVREAVARGGTVQAVSAWLGRACTDVISVGHTRAEQRNAAAAELHREIEEVTRWYGRAVPVTARVVEGPAVSVLTAAARGSDVLVLGRHGRNVLQPDARGTVTEGCIRRAICPVTVIPAPVPAGAT